MTPGSHLKPAFFPCVCVCVCVWGGGKMTKTANPVASSSHACVGRWGRIVGECEFFPRVCGEVARRLINGSSHACAWGGVRRLSCISLITCRGMSSRSSLCRK